MNFEVPVDSFDYLLPRELFWRTSSSSLRPLWFQSETPTPLFKITKGSLLGNMKFKFNNNGPGPSGQVSEVRRKKQGQIMRKIFYITLDSVFWILFSLE